MPHIALRKEGNPNVKEFDYLPDEKMGVEKGTKRKVIVRSHYFQHKVSGKEENDAHNKKPSLHEHRKEKNKSTYHDFVFDVEPKENVEAAGLALNDSSYSQAQSLNKKDDLQVDHTHPTESFSSKGDAGFDLSMDRSENNVKFGCNISHLSHYSSISEKSLEKFVSVLSSFKCAASGSRASGLHAPLKDKTNNTSPLIRIPTTDLSKYSYRPRNHKASVASKTR